MTVSSQGVGAATSATGFSGVDGIIGFGPVDLTEGTVGGSSSTTLVPTFMDNLYKQGSIVCLLKSHRFYVSCLTPIFLSFFRQSTETLGVYFKPESGSDTDDSNGELTLGGVDTSKYTGTLTYFAKSNTSPYS